MTTTTKQAKYRGYAVCDSQQQAACLRARMRNEIREYYNGGEPGPVTWLVEVVDDHIVEWSVKHKPLAAHLLTVELNYRMGWSAAVSELVEQ